MSERFDVVVAGGGLVGASVACALAPLGYRVAVVEAVPPRDDAQPSYDDRTLALNHASCNIVGGLELWDGLAEHATPIREVVVTELGRPGRVRLDSAEMNLDAFGHVVEARMFGQVVSARLRELDAVQVLCPARVASIETGDDAARLEIEGEGGTGTVEASLVVAADGAHSSLRAQLGIGTRTTDYGQTAVICNVTPERAHANRAFERMTPTGPFAVLPHTGDRCGLVWCAAHHEAEEILALPEHEFLERAFERSDRELGRFRKMGRRTSYRLELVAAKRDIDRRVVILGNAAHAIHPAGAQGFNLGLRDVAVLAELLAPARGGERPDPGRAETLAAYHHWREPDRRATIEWTDGMVSLFSSPLALSRGARTAALFAHAVSPPLRRRLASQAMGYRGRIPRLALGEALTTPGRAPV